MAITLIEMEDGKTLEAHAGEKLTKADYQELVPRFEALVQRHGKLRLLFDMSGFHGWDARALWEDMKFDAKHFNDLERIAMVGDRKWQKWMRAFCKPFTTAEVRYFDQTEIAEARSWLKSAVLVAAPSQGGEGRNPGRAHANQ
jgi:hypothetical protein